MHFCAQVRRGPPPSPSSSPSSVVPLASHPHPCPLSDELREAWRIFTHCSTTSNAKARPILYVYGRYIHAGRWDKTGCVRGDGGGVAGRGDPGAQDSLTAPHRLSSLLAGPCGGRRANEVPGLPVLRQFYKVNPHKL